MAISHERAEELIRLCQQEAESAITEGNSPIAAIITDSDGNILVCAHNTQNNDHDASAHAEINALRRLGELTASRYFDGCAMFSNAETCSMCAAAAIKACIRTFYYGAPAEPSMDPWLPLVEIAKASRLPLHVFGPLLADECAKQIARGRARVQKQARA
jgi:tRNA(adenine34) deaminase